MACYSALMKKPVKFKSGCFNWKIKWSEETAEELYGKTDHTTKTVTIYQCASDEVTRETLLHELIHVVLEDKVEAIFNFDPDKKDFDKEENLVRLVSPALMQLINDNPELVRFLSKGGSK